MGKKKKEIIDKEKVHFLEGSLKQGFSKEKASQIYDVLVPFAGYGFNKSHAAGYAVLAYRTAYLKANFPAEFMAANLTNEIHSADKDKLPGCIAEARKIGIAVDPPDINHSQKLFNVVDGRIVYGLLGIKGLGDAAADEIVNCRSSGPYKDFMDFLSRVDIKAAGKGVIERLIQTGAFDKLGVKRGILLGNLERAVDYAQNIKDEKKFGQVSLFGDTGEKEFPDFEFEEFPETGREEKLKNEKELIGFYFSGHPLDEYRELWQKVVKSNLSRPENLIQGSQILLGLVKNVKMITTSKGDKMAFAALEDYNGEIELTFFTSAWEKCHGKIENGRVAILKGKIDYQADKDKYSFTVDEYLDETELERAAKDEEVQARKWERYRNVWKYAKDLELDFPDLSDPAKIEPGVYTIIGSVKSLRNHLDKKGKEMAFGSIQDMRGEIDLVFFARTWENCKALIAVDEIVALKGTIDPKKDRNPLKPGFVVSSIQDLNRLIRAAAKRDEASSGEKETAETPAVEIGGGKTPRREIHIRLKPEAANDENSLYSLLDCLEKNPGICQIYIHIPVLNGVSKETIIRAAFQAAPCVSESAGAIAAVADVWNS